MRASLRGEKFDLSKICNGLETVVRGDKDAIRGVHCQIECESIGVGDLPVNFDLGGANGSVEADGNNFGLTWEKAAQDARFLQSAQAFAQVSRDLAPLYG